MQGTAGAGWLETFSLSPGNRPFADKARSTSATISGLARAGVEPKMSGSDCISSITSSSSKKAASSAAVGTKSSSNPKAGAVSAELLL